MPLTVSAAHGFKQAGAVRMKWDGVTASGVKHKLFLHRSCCLLAETTCSPRVQVAGVAGMRGYED